MKNLVVVIFGFSLLALLSFTSNPNTNNAKAMLYESLIGEWTYDSVIHNDKVEKLTSCDKMDVLRFNPRGRFEALDHVALVEATSGVGTTTNCNVIKSTGKWAVTNGGELLLDNEKVSVLEITEHSLKIKTVIEITNAKFEKTQEVYIDSYVR